MSRLRLVLADDQAMVRAGLALILRAEDDLTVVAEAPDGAAALVAVARHAPDLVLMDVRMPGTDGPTATRRLKAEPGAPAVLMLTTFDDDEVLEAALDSGADGFVLKDSPAEALIAAVRAVAAGGSWIDPRVLPRVIARARRPSGPGGHDARLLQSLTPRETDVLRRMCRGDSNQEIADALRMGERTVKTHVSAVLLKLGARDRVGAVVAALDAGLPRD
ncbi:response regulator transcription factor [Amnibacterium sp. CER49]|uniref:response regulator transcription factor n=1 Tax=Amnibacterium sp. CER49 TaxID=3039161 RepID=UPI002448A448|nr:response regulator transcription factor [Amnibacterium sp. CER49]MDH2444544.1 response regulator transcription factor [Amnibacterium sp. CER49]